MSAGRDAAGTNDWRAANGEDATPATSCGAGGFRPDFLANRRPGGTGILSTRHRRAAPRVPPGAHCRWSLLQPCLSCAWRRKSSVSFSLNQENFPIRSRACASVLVLLLLAQDASAETSRHRSGFFKRAGNIWVEHLARNAAGLHFAFKEKSRNAARVVLHDRSRAFLPRIPVGGGHPLGPSSTAMAG